MPKRNVTVRKTKSVSTPTSKVHEHFRLELLGARAATMTAVLALEHHHGGVLNEVALSLRRHVLEVLDRGARSFKS